MLKRPQVVQLRLSSSEGRKKEESSGGEGEFTGRERRTKSGVQAGESGVEVPHLQEHHPVVHRRLRRRGGEGCYSGGRSRRSPSEENGKDLRWLRWRLRAGRKKKNPHRCTSMWKRSEEIAAKKAALIGGWTGSSLHCT